MNRAYLQTRILMLAFIFNLIWENLQAPLYGDAYVQFPRHYMMCFWAALGDVVFVMTLYLIVAWTRKDWLWFQEIRIRDVGIVILFGGAGAIIVEKVALGLFFWHYTSVMPIIPWINVGLVPILQMLILPLLTFYVATHIRK